MSYQGIEIKVKGILRTALSAEASTTTIDIDWFDEDDNSVVITPQTDTLMFEIDPLNTTGKGSEICLAASLATDTPQANRTRYSTVTRGLLKYGAATTGAAARANSYDPGTPVAIATGTMAKQVNKLTSEVNTLYPTNGVAIQTPAYADATARDAAITSPANGMLIYNTALGVEQQYVGGAWSSVGDTGTPNASATVSGKVEAATTAESQAGTDTGGTGALTFVSPSDIAANVQDSVYSFAADAEASDTYAITLTPAPSAYATGQRFTFTANTANTGAATLNVNALGAKAILKENNVALADNDIESGQVVEVVYDGTQFQMMSPVANAPASAADITMTTDSDTWTPTAGGQTKVITHGLGRTPQFIKIEWFSANGGDTFLSSGTGTYDGSNQCAYRQTAIAATRSTSRIMSIEDAGSVYWYATVTGNTSTTFTLTSAGFTLGVPAYFIWTVY